jgi:anti-anti-sigma factor
MRDRPAGTETPLDEWAPFGCHVERVREGEVVIRPSGELDIATAPTLDGRLRQVADAGAREIVIDLGSLTFIDSTGLRLLLTWRAASAVDGFALALLPGQPSVQRIFSIAGLEDHLPFRRP